MRLSPHERSLFNQVMAACVAALINKGRAKPQAIAHKAGDYALAAVRDARIQLKRSRP